LKIVCKSVLHRISLFNFEFTDDDGATFGANTWLDLWPINPDQLKFIDQKIDQDEPSIKDCQDLQHSTCNEKIHRYLMIYTSYIITYNEKIHIYSSNTQS